MAIVLLLPLYIVLVGLVLAVQYIAVYFWDSKRLRKYHNLNLLCGISNLGYILHLWRLFLNIIFRRHEIHSRTAWTMPLSFGGLTERRVEARHVPPYTRSAQNMHAGRRNSDIPRSQKSQMSIEAWGTVVNAR